MRMDKLTSRFQQAIADAQSLAVGRDNSIIEPAHLLLALLDQQGGGTKPLLAQAGVNVPVLRERLTEALDRLPKVSGQAGNVSVSNDLSRLLNVTDKLAQQRGDAFIASELFVLATVEALGPDFEIRHCNGADREELLPAIADADAAEAEAIGKRDTAQTARAASGGRSRPSSSTTGWRVVARTSGSARTRRSMPTRSATGPRSAAFRSTSSRSASSC